MTNETDVFCHVGGIGTAHLFSIWPLPFESPCETHHSLASGSYVFITPPYDIAANDFTLSVNNRRGGSDDDSNSVLWGDLN